MEAVSCLPMAPLIETRDLQLVSAIVRHGGVTAAARRLHLTQSAVSHHLRELEARLGVTLFERAHRKMLPTEAGRGLLDLADRVLPELVRTERTLRQLSRAPRRVLRLAISCSTAYHWLPRVVAELEAQHPGAELKIAVEAGAAPLEALLKDEIELALCHPEGEIRGLVCTPLFEDEVVGVLAPEHALAPREKLLGPDLAGQTLFTAVASGRDVEHFRRALYPDGGPYPVVRVIPSTEAILELARAGQGIGVVARWALSERAAMGLAVRSLGDKGLWRQWAAYHRRNGPVSDLVPAVLALLGG